MQVQMGLYTIHLRMPCHHLMQHHDKGQGQCHKPRHYINICTIHHAKLSMKTYEWTIISLNHRKIIKKFNLKSFDE